MKFLPYSFKGVKHFLIKRPLSNPEILLAIGNGYFQ